MKRHLRAYLETERLYGMDVIPRGTRAAQAQPRGPVPADPQWESFRAQVLGCTRCGLSQGRTQVVFGVGPLGAPLMLVGEAPGAEEDRQGEPFVGQSGQLLTRLLREMGVSREQVWIGNIVKCRPPNNRQPSPEEIRACIPYLLRQIKRINPKVLCTLGAPATHTLLNTTRSMTELRGKIAEAFGARVLPTFHPAYILRDRSNLPILKQDLRKACEMAGLVKNA
jgi:DNA polymerase